MRAGSAGGPPSVLLRFLPCARAQRLLQRYRPVVLLQEVGYRILDQLLDGVHAIQRQKMQRLPSFRVELDDLALGAGSGFWARHDVSSEWSMDHPSEGSRSPRGQRL